MSGNTYLTLEIKDLVKMSAQTKTELDKMLSQHRRELSIKAMKEYILPRLKAK